MDDSPSRRSAPERYETPQSNIVATPNQASVPIIPPTTPPAPKRLSENRAKTSMDFTEVKHDFGTIKQDSKNTKVFKFTNTGNEPLIIEDAKGTCGCTVPTYPKEPIKPGETVFTVMPRDATSLAKDLMPRLATQFDAGLASDCTNFLFEGDQFNGTRPLFAGKCLAKVEIAGPKPHFVTIRPNALGMTESPTAGAGDVNEASVNAGDIKALVKEIVKGASEKVDLTEAISSANLSLGSHQIYVRTKDSLGRWSFNDSGLIYISKPIAQQQITAIEYSVDTIMPMGGGTIINVK